jgi:CHAT domain-containing protein
VGRATEAAFKTQPPPDFEIIHIAAHGIASAKFPDRAALVLGNDPKSGEDELLQVREIRDLNLAADLVTLSACDTGVGALEGEEGIAVSKQTSSIPVRNGISPGDMRTYCQLKNLVVHAGSHSGS